MRTAIQFVALATVIVAMAIGCAQADKAATPGADGKSAITRAAEELGSALPQDLRELVLAGVIVAQNGYLAMRRRKGKVAANPA